MHVKVMKAVEKVKSRLVNKSVRLNLELKALEKATHNKKMEVIGFSGKLNGAQMAEVQRILDGITH